MAAAVHTLRNVDPEGHQHLGNLITSTYLDGECYAFAVALNEGLGWQMLGLIGRLHGENCIRHVVLQMPGGRFFDARGIVDETALGAPFGLSPPYQFIDGVTKAMLEEVRPVQDSSIAMARRLAEAYWPGLPWKDSLAARALAFAEALESLSRKHRIWLYAPYPTARPGLSESDGEDEKGYSLYPTSDGMKFTLERCFKNR